MGINEITALISSIGFPIVAACAMFWKVNKQDEQHQEEMNKLTEALHNNTIALSKLSDTLDDIGDTNP